MILLSIIIIALVLLHQNRMLKTQRAEALLRMKAVLKKEQEERQRISADLHDTVSGNLSAIRNYLSLVKNRTKDPEILSIVSETAEEIGKTQAEIRRISFNLMPPDLLHSGFLSSLSDYLRRHAERSGFRYTLRHSENFLLKPEAAQQFLQIVRELVSNSVQHGSCTVLEIALHQNGTETEMQYSDDGKTFDFHQCASESSGSGLRNILFRLESLKGSLVQNRAARGNSFTLKIHHDH